MRLSLGLMVEFLVEFFIFFYSTTPCNTSKPFQLLTLIVELFFYGVLKSLLLSDCASLKPSPHPQVAPPPRLTASQSLCIAQKSPQPL